VGVTAASREVVYAGVIPHEQPDAGTDLDASFSNVAVHDERQATR